MNGKKRFKQGVLFLIVVVVVFQFGRQVFMDEEWAARNYVYDRVKSVFSDANDKIQARYGIHSHSGGDIDLNRLPNPIVVLVHGLDEPGRIWLNLAPALAAKGYHVLYMTYPNDQKITASARLFFDALKGVNPKNHLTIIGHSMGGLVSRQMLTDPKINYKRAGAEGLVPEVSDLIMVGTPNHGAQLARFRFFMEIRDQVQNLFERDAHWLQGLLDGTGAAGIDLIPGSCFLTTLNNRPHPSGVNFHVIAGTLSPWSNKDIHAFTLRLKTLFPGQKAKGFEGLESALNTIAATVGDGLVTVGSASLDHIPLTRVRGSHLTMIRNLSQNSERMPPAIPVILKILNRE